MKTKMAMAKEKKKTKSKKEENKNEGVVKIDKKVIKETEKLMKDLLKMFEVDAEATVEKGSYTDVDENENEFVDVKIDGEDIGVLIGYMGRNLRSLQKIVALILNNKMRSKDEDTGFIRVIIDVSGYREKRESSLERMAENIREEVLARDEPVDLPSMSSYERRVIHTHLGEFDDVTTESFGEGQRRYVKVFPVGDGGGAGGDVDEEKVAIGNEKEKFDNENKNVKD